MMDLKYILEQLFPYIVALYLLDCVTYVRRYHLLFVSNFGNAFRLQKSGLRMVGLLPSDRAFLCHSLPIFFTSQRLYFTADKNRPEFEVYKEEDFDHILYDDIKTVAAEGKLLKINGDVVCDTPSGKTADRLARFVRDLTGQPQSKRADRIKAFLAEGADLQKINALQTDNSRLVFCLKVLSCLLFACFFIVLPLALYAGLYVYLDVFFLLIFMALIYIMIPIIAFFAYRNIYKGETGKTGAILPAVLSPVSAMHVLRSLTTEIYARFDFLAVAKVLMPLKDFRVLMRRELFRINYAKTEVGNGGLQEFLCLKEESYHRMLAGSGITLQEILAAPQKQEDDADSYCPLCGTEYLTGPNSCYDCRISLKKFDRTTI